MSQKQSQKSLNMNEDKINLRMELQRIKEERAKNDIEILFETSQDMTCIIDLQNYKFKKVNSAFKKTLGFEKNKFLNRPLLDFVHPDDQEVTGKIFSAILKQKQKVTRFQNRFITNDGDYLFLRWVIYTVIRKKMGYAIAYDITDLSAKIGHQMQNKLNSLIKDNIKFGIWEYNLKEKNMQWSDEVYKIYELDKENYDPDDITSILDLYLEKSRNKLIKSFEKAIYSGKSFNQDLEILTKEGNRKQLKTIAAPLVRSGQVVKIIGALIDLTQYQYRQQDIEFKNNALEFLHSGIGITDLDGHIHYVNQACLKLWGFSNKNEMVGKNIEEIIRFSYQLKEAKQKIQKKTFWSGELTGLRTDGTFFFIHANANLLHDYNEDIRIVFSFIDLNKSRKIAFQYKYNHGKYRAIVENFHNAILILNEHRIIFANNTFLSLTGYKREELISEYINNIFLEDQGTLLEKICSQSKKVGKLEDNFTIILKNGKPEPVKIECYPIEIEGDLDHMLIIKKVINDYIPPKIMNKKENDLSDPKEVITICSSCKRIEDNNREKNNWVEPEVYFGERIKDIKFSHGLCDNCLKDFISDYCDQESDNPDFQDPDID